MSDNTTNNSIHIWRSRDSGQWIYFTVYCLVGSVVIFTAILGNVLIITYYGFKDKRKTPYRIFILTLAISDLAGIISVLFQLIHYILNDFIQSATIPGACKIVRPALQLFLGISSSLVLGMSYERYHGITKPLNSRKITIFHVVVYVDISCVGWILFGIPLYVPIDSCDLFRVLRSSHHVYWITLTFVKAFLPSVLIWYFYFQIKQTLARQQLHFKNSRIFKRNKAVLQTLRLLIILFEIFVAVPSVLQAINLINYKTGRRWQSWNHVLDACAVGLPVINNAVNCFVYAGYMKNFRNFLCHLLCRKTLIRESSVEMTREPRIIVQSV